MEPLFSKSASKENFPSLKGEVRPVSMKELESRMFVIQVSPFHRESSGEDQERNWRHDPITSVCCLLDPMIRLYKEDWIIEIHLTRRAYYGDKAIPIVDLPNFYDFPSSTRKKCCPTSPNFIYRDIV